MIRVRTIKPDSTFGYVTELPVPGAEQPGNVLIYDMLHSEEEHTPESIREFARERSEEYRIASNGNGR